MHTPTWNNKYKMNKRKKNGNKKKEIEFNLLRKNYYKNKTKISSC